MRVEAAFQAFLRGTSEPFVNVVVKAEMATDVAQMAVIVEPGDGGNERSPTGADDAIRLSEAAPIHAAKGRGGRLESDVDNGHGSCDDDMKLGA